jgi:hypothetical protein
MSHGDTREGKWRGNWRMEWVASTLHTTSERVVSSITTADAHNSAASSRLNWRPRRFKWTRPFRLKTKFGFCACAITFQTQSTLTVLHFTYNWRNIVTVHKSHFSNYWVLIIYKVIIPYICSKSFPPESMHAWTRVITWLKMVGQAL